MIAINSKIRYLIIINVLAIIIIPPLNNVHYAPISTFWGEMTYAWLSISLFLITTVAFKKICIPKISLALLIFCIYLIMQQFFVNISFLGITYTTVLEFMICSLLAISISSIVSNLGMTTLITYLAISLLAGGICQSIIGFIQYTGSYKYFSNWIFYDSAHPTSNIFGHFGQRNQYCHYLTWSFFGLIYLTYRKYINYLTSLLIGCWLSFNITIGASRSVILYFTVAFLIAITYIAVKQSRDAWKLSRLIIIGCILIFISEYLYPILTHLFNYHSNLQTGLSRISTIQGGSDAGRRIIEWSKAWIIFKNNPLFGVGWFNYAKQSVNLHNLFPNAPLNSGLFVNCHNLLLQLMAETGLIGTLIVISGIIWIIIGLTIQIYKNSDSNEVIIVLCLIATSIIHSMLEYPFWYLYLLGTFIIFTSMDKPIWQINHKLVATFTIIPVIFIVYTMINCSIIYDGLVNIYAPNHDDLEEFITEGKYLENMVDNNTIMSYPALACLDNYINVDDKFTNKLFSRANQFYYTNKLVDFRPYPSTLIKLAKLYAKSGYQDKALEAVDLAMINYPVYRQSFLNSLTKPQYKLLYNEVNSFSKK